MMLVDTRILTRQPLRLWPLAAGLLVLAALWAGPLPELSRTSFSSHMILHLGLVVLAAPLLAIGLSRWRPLPRQAPLVGLGILAAVVELAVVWGWHAPAMHEAAAFSPAIFVLQQGSFLAAGLLVWLPGLASGRGSAGAGVLAMLMSFMHMSMLGVLLATTPRLLYSPLVCAGGFGLTPLQDQQLGGVLMATTGGLSYLAGGVYSAFRFVSRSPATSAGRDDGAGEMPEIKAT